MWRQALPVPPAPASAFRQTSRAPLRFPGKEDKRCSHSRDSLCAQNQRAGDRLSVALPSVPPLPSSQGPCSLSMEPLGRRTPVKNRLGEIEHSAPEWVACASCFRLLSLPAQLRLIVLRIGGLPRRRIKRHFGDAVRRWL